MIFEAITALIRYGEKNGFFSESDRVFVTNSIISALSLDGFEYTEPQKDYELSEILGIILDYAVKNNLCEDSVTFRDLFDTRTMGLVLPRPSEVIKVFYEEYEKSPTDATEYFYDFCRKSDYIRQYRIINDLKWVTHTDYGDIDITVNLSKPEKDPKAIAAALTVKNSGYPECMLCRENEGYAGRVNHPARQNLRMIPIEINGEQWYFQYSPYVYYNEHCIVLSGKHAPMVINKSAFNKLFDFVRQFPHYFIGSNADLPIVGGSILTHEHFQGGNYTFAMAKAPIETEVTFKGYEDIKAGIVKWPMSVIRISGKDTARLSELADRILSKWRSYTDEEAFIYAFTDNTPHNTITPIARYTGGNFELDLVLRNNITTAEYPDGVYHPHPEYHHIKKENIGLIEVMGLAVLPSRLKDETELLKSAFINNTDIRTDEKIAKHAKWFDEILSRRTVTADNFDYVIEDEIGKVFTAILRQCGVFARDEKGKQQFLRFIDSVK